jgi:hypothetical protein
MKEWVLKHRVDVKYLMGVNISPTHNWALDTSKPNDYMKKCFFINNNLCLMKWDGNIISCCFDFDGINTIGHVDNFENLKHRTDYKLCESCSSAWVNQQNDIYYTFPTTLKVAGLE